MFIAELEHPEFKRFDLSSLRTGVMAGATCPEEVMRRVQNLMYMQEVLIGYGQTECSPLNHITEIDSPVEKRVLTVGRALPHTEVKIVDEFGEVLPINTPGEVCSRGYCIMQCYWNDPEKRRKPSTVKAGCILAILGKWMSKVMYKSLVVSKI